LCVRPLPREPTVRSTAVRASSVPSTITTIASCPTV
jgi:hypothetical protein